VSNGAKLGAALLLLPALAAGLAARVRTGYPEHGGARDARAAIVRMLSVATIAHGSDCISTRNLLEGIYGCLGDVPGGYCYHSSCDVICAPDFPDEDVFTLRIIRAESE
jgi:hypothetical protein